MLGLIIGLVIGVTVARGTGTAAVAAAPQGGAAPQGAPAGDPHAVGGMDSVSAQMAELRRRLDANPEDAEAHARLGELFLEANMAERAHEALHRALDLAKDDAPLLTRIAAGLARTGPPDEAMRAAERALALERNAPQPAELAARIAVHSLADPVRAERAIGELKRRAPDAPVVAELEKELATMREVLDAAAARPSDYEAQLRAANFLYDHGRWPDAERTYRRALELRGGDPNVITDLGMTMLNQGRAREALAQFEEAQRRDPQHWQSALNGVVVSLDLGDAASARGWLARLKAARPEHPAIPQFEQRIAAGG